MPVGVQSLLLSIYSEIILGMSEDGTWVVACIAKPYMLYYLPSPHLEPMYYFCKMNGRALIGIDELWNDSATSLSLVIPQI